MKKQEWIDQRTKIISKLLDNPNQFGIFPTGVCFAELDDLFDKLVENEEPLSGAQILRNKKILTESKTKEFFYEIALDTSSENIVLIGPLLNIHRKTDSGFVQVIDGQITQVFTESEILVTDRIL
jgi:hypothetical protein